MEVVDRTQRNFIEVMNRKYCNARASWEMKLEIKSGLNSSESLKSHKVHRLHSNALTSLCVGSFLYRSLIFGTATNSDIFFHNPKSQFLTSKLAALTHIFPLFSRSVASLGLIFESSVHFWSNQVKLY